MSVFERDRALFTIFGFPVKINPSWLLLFGLIVASLSVSWFPGSVERIAGIAAAQEISRTVYWLMGVVGAVALFASLIVHELCHSLVARRTGMPVGGITLFIFGGVSELKDEPPTPLSEFFMAVVGPLSSLAIGSVFAVLCFVGSFMKWHALLVAVFAYLWFVNWFLALFNSVPAFPLDGGRILRSVLWAITGQLRTATHIAAGIGSFLGLALIVGGVLLLFNGIIILGIWCVCIGFFVRQAARSSFRHTIIRQELEGEKASRFMTREPVTVSPQTSLQDFVYDYVLNYHFRFFPVVDDAGKLIGVVDARDPKKAPREQWPDVSVGEVMARSTESISLRADADAVEALVRLREAPVGGLVIVEDGRPVGIINLRNLMDFLALKIDLSLSGPVRR